MFFSRREFLGSVLSGVASNHFSSLDQAPSHVFEDRPLRLDTLFLTWQRDPTTTMTVQWVAAAEATRDTSVYYSVASEASPWLIQPTMAKPYPKPGLKVFRAELTGLTPGTDYQFQIGRHSQTYRFRTMPGRANDTISFISGGDCGTNSHAIANNVQAARQDPMFAIIGGDLAYENGRSADTHLAFLRNYSKSMVARGGRLIPMIACIGNHEVAGHYHQHRADAPFFYSLFDGLFTETGYTKLDFGDYLCLVLLDTGHTSEIGGAQADWLEHTLKARVDHPNVIAVNHVPAYPSFRSMTGLHGLHGTGEDNRVHWVPLFEKYRVPVVLEHHDHTFKRTRPLRDGRHDENGVLYLGDGSWGQLRSPHTPEELSIMATTSRDYHLSLHRIQGEERFHLALDENGRIMDIAHTRQRLRGRKRARI
jgi:hypothetical protein